MAKFISTIDAANQLGLSPHSFRRQMKAGRIPQPYRTERPWLFNVDELTAWVAAGRPQDVSVWLASRSTGGAQ